MLHIKRDVVREVQVTGPEGAWALKRTGGGDWIVSQPIQTQAGRWSVDGLLGNLESLRMDSVVDENPADLKPFGLDKPDVLEPIQPLIDALGKMEEIELFPTGFLHMTTVHVGFLMATDIMWSQVESLWANAAPRIHRFEPFDLALGGISAFDDSLYIGIDDGGGATNDRNPVAGGANDMYFAGMLTARYALQ